MYCGDIQVIISQISCTIFVDTQQKMRQWWNKNNILYNSTNRLQKFSGPLFSNFQHLRLQKMNCRIPDDICNVQIFFRKDFTKCKNQLWWLYYYYKIALIYGGVNSENNRPCGMPILIFLFSSQLISLLFSSWPL